MQSAEFRRFGHEIVDWIADYLDGVGAYPVRAQVAPGEVAARLAEHPPDAPEAMDRVLEDFREVILPGMTHWQHPRFFAYFPANSSRPSVLAEMLTAALGAQCMSWETSPAATELEERVLEWLRKMVGLPVGFVGCIQDTASSATLCAMLAARNRQAARDRRDIADMTVYCSEEAHSSVLRGAAVLGIDRRHVRLIPVDDEMAMRVDRLDATIAADRAGGRHPICVVATLGTTGASGFDRLDAIGPVCARHGVWLHVDAAWAGSALVLPEARWMLSGVEAVDSFVFNPHKWLFTNFDCSAFYVRDRDTYLEALAIDPEYLKTRYDAAVTNYRNWGIALGRRFRALKLWFVIRTFGVRGLRARLRAHIEMAHALAAEVDAARDFEVMRPPVLSHFCFRYRPADLDGDALDALNERLLQAVNAGGTAYLSHTRLRGRYAIRFVVGQTNTTAEDVRRGWEEIQRVARDLGAT